MKLTKKHLKIVLGVGALLIVNQYLGWFDLGLPIAIFGIIFCFLAFEKDGKFLKSKGSNNVVGNYDNDFDHGFDSHDSHDSSDSD